jgi:hypothetical protein
LVLAKTQISGLWPASLFFILSQPATINPFMQRRGQHPSARADRWHAHPSVQHLLHLDQSLRGQPVPLPLGGRGEKHLGSSFPKFFQVAFDRPQGHPEGSDDLPLRRRSVDDELATKEPERRQITGLMREDRQMTVEIHDLFTSPLERQLRRNEGGPLRENRQLSLWHGQRIKPAQSPDKPL